MLCLDTDTWDERRNESHDIAFRYVILDIIFSFRFQYFTPTMTNKQTFFSGIYMFGVILNMLWTVPLWGENTLKTFSDLRKVSLHRCGISTIWIWSNIGFQNGLKMAQLCVCLRCVCTHMCRCVCVRVSLRYSNSFETEYISFSK